MGSGSDAEGPVSFDLVCFSVPLCDYGFYDVPWTERRHSMVNSCGDDGCDHGV